MGEPRGFALDIHLHVHRDGGIEESFDGQVHDVSVFETDPISETHSAGESLGGLDVGGGDVDANYGTAGSAIAPPAPP